MTRLGDQLREAQNPARRHRDLTSGRRFRFLLALTLGAAWAWGPPAALADQPVVNATIYPASSGNVSTQSVTLGALQGCPLYSGANPMYLYPGDQPYSPAASSSWALSTVLTCGLRLPLNAVRNVQVDNPPHGFETSLTNAELSDASQFHDPAAPGALPVISVDGAENQTTYVRPWLGGSDANAADQVISSGSPVTVVIYENGPPLAISASGRTASRKRTTLTVQFRAVVHDPNGGAIPGSSLTWSWDFSDGSTSTVVSPRHAFAPGVYPVTVQVSDNSTGRGGTATIEVRFSPSTGARAGSARGAGPSRRTDSPSGPQNSSGTHPGKAPGKPTANTASSRTSPPSGSKSAPGPTQASNTGRRTVSPAATQQKPPTGSRVRRHPAPRHAAAPRRGRAPAVVVAATPPSHAPLIAGQLVSDVATLPPGASPLWRLAPAAVATAPPVRGASQASVLPALVAGFAVALLFGLGAAHELRGQREWHRALRFARLMARAH